MAEAMTGVPLRTLGLLCLAVAASADLFLYEEQIQGNVPGVESHSWMLVGDGQDGSSGFVMQVDTLSVNGGASTQGFSDGTGALDDGFGHVNAYEWVTQQLNSFQNLPFFVSAYPEDSQGQMLRSVANVRFDSALTDVRSQYGSNHARVDNANADTSHGQSWVIELGLTPHGPDMETDQTLTEEQVQAAMMRQYVMAQRRSSAAEVGHVLNRCLFSVLLFACVLTLFACLKQGCELRRAVKGTGHKASEIAYCGEMEAAKPLLQKNGLEHCDEEYTIIAPISEPALKAIYP